ncbi:MAG: hypothetical protein IT295_01930, partial [Dehalococcoidia bacterium]|nr:hypothetical protein [Dehalococcoidia bacterium]
MTQPPSLTDLMSQWKTLNDQFIASLGKGFDAFLGTAEGQAAADEAGKTYVATRANLARAARETFGPMVEAAGAVPLAEFQRLMDQVHTILLRLDRIDDALAKL